MKFTANIALVLAVIALAIPTLACDNGEATLDGSSEEALEESMEKMTEDMSEAEAEELAMAIMGIVMAELGEEALMGEVDEEAEQKVLDELDGMTAEDILEKAEELGAEGGMGMGGDMDHGTQDLDDFEDDFEEELEELEDIEAEMPEDDGEEADEE